MKHKKLKVTLLKSVNGIHPKHKECVKGLGLRRIRHSVHVVDNECVRGMVKKVNYLVSVEEV